MRWGACFFFFFQAEDGIRDYKVTGVQTCALPIGPFAQIIHAALDAGIGHGALQAALPFIREHARPWRSEERRVGKSVDLGGRRIIKKKKERNEWWWVMLV